jgi:hypothetical protein
MPTMSTRRRGATLVVAVVLTASGAGLATTGTAQAAPAPAPAPSPVPSPIPSAEPEPLPATTPSGPAGVAAASVVAVTAGDVRTGPHSSDRVVSHVVRNNSYPAECWMEGDPVIFQGVSRRNWVRLQLVRGGTGYVNAIYLKGNDRGNVTDHC